MKLPDYTDLGQAPRPSPSEQVARISNPDAAAVAGEQLGAETQKAGLNLKNIIDTAEVNDVMSNDFQPKLRALAQNFYSLQGKQAMEGAPVYSQQVQSILQDSVGNLGGEAARKFQSMAQPIVDKELYNASEHAGRQTIQYAHDSHDAALNNHLIDLQNNIDGNDFPSAHDSVNLMYAQEIAFMKQQGIDPNGDIGKYRLNVLDQKVQEGFEKSIAAMPAEQQIQLAHAMKPSGPTSSSSAPSSSYNLGNVKTAKGAADNTMDFVNPATPVDGAALTANTLRRGYQNMSLEQIGKKWTGESPEKVAAWVSNVSKASGIAPDATPDMDDPAAMQALLSGVATAEKSPEDRKNFTPDVIAQGVSKSLAGEKVNLAEASASGESGQAPAAPSHSFDFNGFTIKPQTAEKIIKAALANKRIDDSLRKEDFEKRLHQFADDPKFVSMVQVPQDIREGFGKQPDAQKYLEARAEYNMKNTQNIVDADRLQYGSGFYNLLENVYSPNGISDASDLYKYTGKDGIITIDGFNALKGELEQKKTPEGQAVATAKSRLFNTGASAIYGQARNYGVQDPKGEELHQKWMALTLSQYQSGIKAGKSPSALLDPESPDYVGKSISMFMRSPEEQMKQGLNLPPRTLDAITSDIKYGRMTKEQAQQEAPALLRQEYARGTLTKQQLNDYLMKFNLLKDKSAIIQQRAPRPGLEDGQD